MSDEPSNGHLNWRGWAFDYGVIGTEGLALLNGYFKKTRVFQKLSLPVIRVKYTKDEDFPSTGPGPFQKEGCGPYNDKISWDTTDFGEDLLNWAQGGPHHLVKMEDCFDRYICITERLIGSETWLELGVYARIGAYHIYQTWFLHETGRIMPRVFSKGLSCDLDHWHHPYWRFGIDGLDRQRTSVYDGANYIMYFQTETQFQNAPFGANVRYAVENRRTGTEVSIFPPKLDEQLGIVGPDAFAPWDGILRKYRASEDVDWGSKPEDFVPYTFYENPDDERVVFWSICHLSHHADEGADHWHSIGPNLEVKLSDKIPVRPHERRLVSVDANIHVKDYRIGNDKWGHFNRKAETEVNPREEYDEFFFDTNQAGDTNAQLLIRIHYQSDLSVLIEFEAHLFDEEERVASTGSQFFVMRDASQDWTGIHLVDYHVGDPDTCDMDFRIRNVQV